MGHNILILTALLSAAIISGCTQIPDDTGNGQASLEDAAKDLCIRLCMGRIFVAGERESGPCLSDGNANWNVTDWVCDVAHSPRQAVDNEPANQCAEFRQGNAHHFIEVDTLCNFIRST